MGEIIISVSVNVDTMRKETKVQGTIMDLHKTKYPTDYGRNSSYSTNLKKQRNI